MTKTITSRLPSYCNTYGLTHEIVHIGTNKYEHQHIHHFNWLFRYFYKMYDNEFVGSTTNSSYPKHDDIEIIHIIELMYSFPISVHDFVTIALSVYETYDYFKTSKKVTDFITKIKIIFLLIKNRHINVRQLSFVIDNICLCVNDIKNSYLFICDIFDKHLSLMRTLNYFLSVRRKKCCDAIKKLEKYKIEKIEFIKEQFKQTSKHIEYALEECDMSIKLLSYIEHSNKYDVMYDNISHKILCNPVQKYNYCVSNTVLPSKYFEYEYFKYGLRFGITQYGTFGTAFCLHDLKINDNDYNKMIRLSYVSDCNKKKILHNLKRENKLHILNILNLYNRTLYNSVSST